MLGSIIGDLAGSIYEYGQISEYKPIIINKIIEENSFYSDDTILTVAIADAIINKKDYVSVLKQYVKDFSGYLPDYFPYFKTTFSPNFMKWANSNEIGNSHGNGAMMRIAPVGFLFNSEKEVVENVKLATAPSHNSFEAISSATTIALIIFYFRLGLSKNDVISKLNLNIVKPIVEKFNYTCETTLPICLYSIFNSNSFENAILLAISFGGDTDTNACIVGGMAEALYGIENSLKLQAIKKMPSKFQKIINQYYEKIDGKH
ncbi:MAG: hypothetical protein EOM55_02525 [Clostridia bacterium]|nr:hypothetical protein [Clostridia bacterium]